MQAEKQEPLCSAQTDLEEEIIHMIGSPWAVQVVLLFARPAALWHNEDKAPPHLVVMETFLRHGRTWHPWIWATPSSAVQLNLLASLGTLTLSQLK